MQSNKEHKGRAPSLIDQVFGRLTVTARSEKRPHDDRAAYWYCTCSCGYAGIIRVRGTSLRYGATQSCGCLKKEQLLRIRKKYFAPNPKTLTAREATLLMVSRCLYFSFDVDTQQPTQAYIKELDKWLL